MTFIDATLSVLWFFIVILSIFAPPVGAIILLCLCEFATVKRTIAYVTTSILIVFFYIVSWVYFSHIPENIWSPKEMKAWAKRVTASEPAKPVLPEQP